MKWLCPSAPAYIIYNDGLRHTHMFYSLPSYINEESSLIGTEASAKLLAIALLLLALGLLFSCGL
jgi:hypothetical protein